MQIAAPQLPEKCWEKNLGDSAVDTQPEKIQVDDQGPDLPLHITITTGATSLGPLPEITTTRRQPHRPP